MIINSKIELVGALLKIAPVDSILAENSMLHLELAKPEKIKGRPVLYVNDKPFAMDGFTFAVPADALLDGANTLVLQITADGKEPRLYRSLEKLIISKDKLQEEEVKRIQSELEFYKQHYLKCTEKINVIDEFKKQIAKLAESHNKAIKTVNDLSERLAALEKNYDPTVID